MPRTKAVKKKAPEKFSKLAEDLLPTLENHRRVMKNAMNRQVDNIFRDFRKQLLQSKLSIPKHMADKTIDELVNLPLNWSGNTTSASIVQVLNATKTMSLTEKKNRTVTRSSSCDDEDGRQSRARSRLMKTARTSRSLSTRQKKVGSSIDKFKTPANRLPPQSFNTVTPKMKPNTPQVVLRRPKMGEIAMSMQGSPLMTGPVVSDNVANINIPLDDGRLMTIQPERGLRMSQIPQLDPETKRQLETLRDNLNKVCALSARQ